MYNVSIIFQFSDGHKEIWHENGYDYEPSIEYIKRRRCGRGITIYKVFVFKVK